MTCTKKGKILTIIELNTGIDTLDMILASGKLINEEFKYLHSTLMK